MQLDARLWRVFSSDSWRASLRERLELPCSTECRRFKALGYSPWAMVGPEFASAVSTAQLGCPHTEVANNTGTDLNILESKASVLKEKTVEQTWTIFAQPTIRVLGVEV